MHLVHPHHGSLLPSTVHNVSALVNIICIHIGGHTLSISAKLGSATHFPTSTASAGLPHLFVGACVHSVWFKAVSHCMWPPPCAIFCASQLLASLGGHQLEPRSLERKRKFALLQPESSSVAVEMREGSNTLLYQRVYLWFEMPVCSWHGTFTIYNHRVRASWDKPFIEPLHSTKNELVPSRCAAKCYLIS